MTIMKILQKIWSFILGSLRIILFLSCLIFVLVQICSLAIQLFFYKSYQDMPIPHSPTRELFEDIALLGLALGGCYGSFYKHHPTLKIFSLFSSIYVFYTFFVVLYIMSPAKIAQQKAEFSDKLTKLQETYIWTTEGKVNNPANELWDNTQKLMCCGLEGPSDWDQYRPHEMAPDSLPSSCCIRGIVADKICHRRHDVIFENGCMDQLHKIQYNVFLVLAGVIGTLFFMSLMAFIIGYFNLERFKKDRQQAVQQPMTIQGNPTLLISRGVDYSQINNRAYERLPPVNQSYSAAMEKNELQLNDAAIGHLKYEPAPPSYKN